MKDCSKCLYGGIDEFGDSWCNYFNINPVGICVYDIIEKENKEYVTDKRDLGRRDECNN